MEKQVWNASKRMAAKNAVKRRRLPSLPQSTNGAKQKRNKKQALHSLQSSQNGIEQGQKTIEIIDGIPQFFIVIPCMAGTPDRKSPLYLVKENELGGAESGVWQCQECTRIYHTRKAWAKHAGMISNIMGNCPGG